MKTLTHVSSRKKMEGFSLLEVIIAIGVFAVGALALAGLQTSVTLSSSSAKDRTTAVNIAQAEMEKLRGFMLLASNGGSAPSFADISSTISPETATVDGTVYSITREVTPYYWVANNFTDAVPTPAPTFPNFKQVVVNVSWTNPSGSVQSTALTDVISSLSTASSGRVIAGGGGSLAPPLPYIPGERPDIAAIDIGEHRFKETLTPEPEVFSDSQDGQFVMTGFDVITYSQNPDDESNRFLRREENRILNCECTLKAADDGIETHQPSVWTGEQYANGNRISKQYGIPASGRTQDPLCDICCRDHHDTSIPDSRGVDPQYLPDPGRFKYDPWNAETVHSHYGKDASGNLITANTDENYFEACRLIRSDGFFRVAQDLNVTNLVTTPEYYLKEESELEAYSDYVTEIVTKFINALTPLYPGLTPSVDDFVITNPVPASTSLPEPLNLDDPSATVQQLRSRAVYIDYITRQARDIYNCMDTDGNSGADCGAPQLYSALETVPFFEVNNTHLAEWRTDTVSEVTVTNERLPLGLGKSYSRGVAKKVGTATTKVVATSMVAPSNTGMTNTDAISPADKFSPFAVPPVSGTGRVANIDINVSGGGTPNPTGITVSGQISAQKGTGINANQVGVFLTGGTCQSAGGAFTCTFPASGTGTIVIAYYNKPNKNYAACDVSTYNAGIVQNDGNPSTETTSFNFSGLTVNTTMNILISKQNNC